MNKPNQQLFAIRLKVCFYSHYLFIPTKKCKYLGIFFHFLLKQHCIDWWFCNFSLRANLALGPGYDVSTSRLDIQYRQEIQLNVSVSNNGGEPAYSAELQVNIDPAFAYVGRSDDVRDIHCDFRGVGLGVLCRFVPIFSFVWIRCYFRFRKVRIRKILTGQKIVK